jgi:hypothetical protein
MDPQLLGLTILSLSVVGIDDIKYLRGIAL